MNKKTKQDISVIIPAAGQGKRMGRQSAGKTGRPVSKPFIRLKGIPILFHSINTFQGIPGVKEIIIALSSTDLARTRRSFKQPRISCELKLVRGGSRRQDSVFNALKAVAPESRYVIIHDAARPLVKRTHITRLIKETKKFGACILAVPTTDTIKRINPITRQVKYTLGPREEFWSVQTPQGFKKDILIKAHKKARLRGAVATDDASLVEVLGHPVKVIPGSYDNIKITTPMDNRLCRVLMTRK